MKTSRLTRSCITAALASLAIPSFAQETIPPTPPAERPPTETRAPQEPKDVFIPDRAPAPADLPFGPGGPRDGFRPGRGPGFGMQEKKLVAKFDKDGDNRLDATERQAAREFLRKEREEEAKRRESGDERRRGPDGPRRFGGREDQGPAEPGKRISPADIKRFPAMPLYDSQTMRTFFVEFENADWEEELSDFKRTDVEVPAKLAVDGKSYPDVGIRFRGASSLMVREGRKRSLNVSLNYVDNDQRLYGYRTLNLLNSNGDPTFLRAVLYNQIAREYIPAPKANYARVVINGENWGIYVNVQQFNKDFVDEWFGTKKGDRWKAPGRPNGNSGLEYLGDDAAEYKKRFEIKSDDNPKAWAALIELCKVLNQTPSENLEEAIEPILNVDGVLKFLALENVFINTDGYWTRASDYCLYRDEKGRFHIIPHDVNETFRSPEGPGMRGMRGAEQGAERRNPLELDPFAGAEDARKPLLSKLLAVPALRKRYAAYVREIAERWLDWGRLAPIAGQYHALIADEVKSETRALASFDAFTKGVGEDIETQGPRGPRRSISLKTFAEQRRQFLLNHPEISQASVAQSIR